MTNAYILGSVTASAKRRRCRNFVNSETTPPYSCKTFEAAKKFPYFDHCSLVMLSCLR
jgi:hypothetical protein